MQSSAEMNFQPIMSPSEHPLPAQIPENVVQLLSVAKILLLQAIGVVDKLTEDDQLTTSSKYLPGSTIGMCASNIYNHASKSPRKTYPTCARSLRAVTSRHLLPATLCPFLRYKK